MFIFFGFSFLKACLQIIPDPMLDMVFLWVLLPPPLARQDAQSTDRLIFKVDLVLLYFINLCNAQ